MKTKTNTKTLDQFVEEQYGKRGSKKREKFEKGYEHFKIGVLLQQARLEKGLTQDQRAAAPIRDISLKLKTILRKSGFPHCNA
jgi:hypothetical protein